MIAINAKSIAEQIGHVRDVARIHVKKCRIELRTVLEHVRYIQQVHGPRHIHDAAVCAHLAVLEHVRHIAARIRIPSHYIDYIRNCVLEHMRHIRNLSHVPPIEVLIERIN